MDFGGFQPLCLHLHIPDLVQYPGPDRYTVCAGFGASPKRASQRPEPSHHHTPSARWPQPPAATKKPSHPASDQPCLQTPPPPQFRPPHGRGRLDNPKPSVPPTPRHLAATANPAAASTQPGRTLLVAAVSPDGHTAPSTAVAIAPSTPHPALTYLPTHPSTRQSRIQPHQPLVREDISSSNNVHNFNGETFNTRKQS